MYDAASGRSLHLLLITVGELVGKGLKLQEKKIVEELVDRQSTLIRWSKQKTGWKTSDMNQIIEDLGRYRTELDFINKNINAGNNNGDTVSDSLSNDTSDKNVEKEKMKEENDEKAAVPNASISKSSAADNSDKQSGKEDTKEKKVKLFKCPNCSYQAKTKAVVNNHFSSTCYSTANETLLARMIKCTNDACKKNGKYFCFDHRCSVPPRQEAKDSAGNKIKCPHCQHWNTINANRSIGVLKIKAIKSGTFLVCSLSNKKGINCTFHKQLKGDHDATKLDVNNDAIKKFLQPSSHVEAAVEAAKQA